MWRALWPFGDILIPIYGATFLRSFKTYPPLVVSGSLNNPGFLLIQTAILWHPNHLLFDESGFLWDPLCYIYPQRTSRFLDPKRWISLFRRNKEFCLRRLGLLAHPVFAGKTFEHLRILVALKWLSGVSLFLWVSFGTSFSPNFLSRPWT